MKKTQATGKTAKTSKAKTNAATGKTAKTSKAKTNAATGNAAKTCGAEWARLFNVATDEQLAENRRKFYNMILRGLDYYEFLGLCPDKVDEADEKCQKGKRAWRMGSMPFLSGMATGEKGLLDFIGVETLYALLVEIYEKYRKQLYYRCAFSVEDHKDLLAILSARKSTYDLKVCGEGVDIAQALWGLETERFEHEEQGRKKDADELKPKIAEYKERLRSLGEEVYETLKRGERQAAAAGTFTRDRFEGDKRALLAWGAPDMKQKQRERAAQWLKDERAAGRQASIVDAARQYGNEIEAEKPQCGYHNVDSLAKALNYHAKELGIAQFIESGKRGRPRKG